MKPFFATLRIAPLLAVMLVAAGTARADAPLLERDVLPILTKQCMGCHGGLIKKGGLDLRTLPSIIKGGDTGPGVVAGQLNKSEIWTQIANGEMPKGDKRLSAPEKETVRAWIAAGLPTFADRKDKQDDPLLPAGTKHKPEQVAAAIDQHIEAQLAAAQLSAAPVADDAEFMRRVYLDLVGRTPTPLQAKAFLDDKAPDKRARLIDALLDKAEFGEQMGRTWRDWICPPELPSDMNSGKQPINEARQLGVWFAKRINDGDAWDKIVRDLLNVNGDIKNNPQLIYYGLVGHNAKATPDGSARTVASLFMGVQLQCAQCHDDPYRDWAQNEFWSLAGFFGKVTGDFKKISETPADHHIVIPPSAFKNAGAKVQVAFLRNDAPLEKKKANLRPIFLDWLTDQKNPYFARAYANRMWFYLFSRGIVNPVDDIRDLNPPSHPGLMRLLANEFNASRYDVKHLMRCLCNSKTYQRSSRVDINHAESKRDQQVALFGRAPMRVMSADMLLDSLKLAYGDPKLDLRTIEKDDGNVNGESAAVGDPYLEFHRTFGTNEEDATDFTHGIPQMLTFINHPRLLEGSAALDEYLKTKPSPTTERTIEWLYMATLSRRPSVEEAAEAKAYVAQFDDADAAYVDVLWMLINRSEFILVR